VLGSYTDAHRNATSSDQHTHRNTDEHTRSPHGNADSDQYARAAHEYTHEDSHQDADCTADKYSYGNIDTSTDKHSHERTEAGAGLLCRGSGV
jgi:hypothetical protein